MPFSCRCAFHWEVTAGKFVLTCCNCVDFFVYRLMLEPRNWDLGTGGVLASSGSAFGTIKKLHQVAVVKYPIKTTWRLQILHTRIDNSLR